MFQPVKVSQRHAQEASPTVEAAVDSTQRDLSPKAAEKSICNKNSGGQQALSEEQGKDSGKAAGDDQQMQEPPPSPSMLESKAPGTKMEGVNGARNSSEGVAVQQIANSTVYKSVDIEKQDRPGSILNDVVPTRIYKPEPDIAGIRFYLESDRKHHLPGITHNRRNLIRQASRNYHLENGTLMYTQVRRSIAGLYRKG